MRRYLETTVCGCGLFRRRITTHFLTGRAASATIRLVRFAGLPIRPVGGIAIMGGRAATMDSISALRQATAFMRLQAER